MKFKKMILAVFIVFILLAFSGLTYLLYGQKKVKKTTLEGVNVSQIKDGSYIGEFEGYRWDTRVEVRVKNQKIVAISVLDDQVFYDESVKRIITNRVIENQSTDDIDTVSGATISSKAYLKAIEDALKESES